MKLSFSYITLSLKSRTLLTFGFSLLLLSTCVSPADIEPGEFDPILVVEGFITDDFGPHEIRVTRVTRFAGVTDGGGIRRVEASLSIIDDQGNETPLIQRNLVRKEIFNEPPGCFPNLAFVEGPSNYMTPDDFRGEVGRTYTLQIIVGDQVYRSEPQTIISTPAIESLSLSFVELPSVEESTSRSGVDIFAEWNDPEGNDFYTWRINGIYRIATPPLGGTACCLYDPRDGGAMDCWINETNIDGSVTALSDRFFNGGPAVEKVAFLEDDGLRFASQTVPGDKQYYIEVEQYRISEEAFNFLETIETISSIDGEIFDPPPLSVRGNIFNQDDQEERVIGFFGAYSVQRKDIFVPSSLLPFRQRFTRPCGDCRLRRGAQTEIPDPYK